MLRLYAACTVFKSSVGDGRMYASSDPDLLWLADVHSLPTTEALCERMRESCTTWDHSVAQQQSKDASRQQGHFLSRNDPALGPSSARNIL